MTINNFRHWFCLRGSLIMMFLVAGCANIHSGGPRSEPPPTLYSQADYKNHPFSLQPRRIQFVLPDVYRIDIIKFVDANTWKRYVQGDPPRFEDQYAAGYACTRDTDPALLDTLRQSTHYHTDVPQITAHTGFVIFCWAEHELDMGPHGYAYISETGELGRGHDWCRVPVLVRKRIDQIIHAGKSHLARHQPV